MELTKSVVWETLRLDPPVKFQYGRAKADLQIESHDAVYDVKKGEMLFGYQPCATKDTRVFGPTAGQFVGDRFVGEEGSKLLQYVYWSNGRETESPSLGNKQCPGKNLVVLVGRLFLVELFLRYDTFTGEVGKDPLGAKVAFTGITKATSGLATE
uniref:Aos n=1 Tax=Arundo donax TaxID=35708 RepID=A0A0A9GNC5_ARUDO